MKSLLHLAIAIALCGCALGQSVPNLINYQGRLTDQSGAALPIGNYGLEFRLWDSPTGTNLIWAQQQNVSAQANGVFNVILGAPGGSAITNPVPMVNDLGFALTSSNRFLGMTVVSSNGVPISGATEILPRQQLLSVPFALMSQQVANGAISSPQIAVGGIQNSNLAVGIVSPTNLIPRQV